MAVILTATEVAALSGISYPTLRRKIDNGEIRAEREGRDLVLDLADVIVYLSKCRKSPEGNDGEITETKHG